MPWNFQHYVHVDEGFVGLPPSWTTSLQEAGFSDDEIAAIQQRRLADRPRDRSYSPATVLRPVPRSTSLPKSQHTPASSLSTSSASTTSASSSLILELPRARNDDFSKNGPSPEQVEFPEDFIDKRVDPREYYRDLQEIAVGESGSVYAAVLVPTAPLYRLKLPPLLRARDQDDVINGRRVLVAIKSVALLPGGNPKLADVERECRLLSGLRCEQVLGMDALYIDLVDNALWIRMELMERSLADVVGLVDEGLRLQEPRVMARFASDMLQALDYLQKHHIAHRDLRSDNLLLNSEGVLKLTDFSNAVLVTPETPLSTDLAGVVYWQAPEVRSGAYDPLKIDVWSVGATVWELAEAAPPFSDTQQPAERWPAVSQPALYPPAFHEFLRLCSEPAASRPTPRALLEGPFLQKACGRPVIIQLLSRCMEIEQALQAPGPLPEPPAS
ncbi:kinase-like domain-containing protein [Mycena epipterygia]|nr:kinase-like domain-containing protein [Mycena epipterygia]